MEQGIDGNDLLGMFRVKGKLNAIFMSDITTADEKFIEDFSLDSQHPTETVYKYKFPGGTNRGRLEQMETSLATKYQHTI